MEEKVNLDRILRNHGMRRDKRQRDLYYVTIKDEYDPEDDLTFIAHIWEEERGIHFRRINLEVTEVPESLKRIVRALVRGKKRVRCAYVSNGSYEIEGLDQDFIDGRPLRGYRGKLEVQVLGGEEEIYKAEMIKSI